MAFRKPEFTNSEFPLRPHVDEITLYEFRGKLYYHGKESTELRQALDQAFDLKGFDDLRSADASLGIKTIYEYPFTDESMLPTEVRKAVRSGNSSRQIAIAQNIKEVMSDRGETYQSIADNARIPPKRGSKPLGEHQIENTINQNRYMTAEQASALCDYLHVSIERFRHDAIVLDMEQLEPFAEGTRAASTLDHVQKALYLYEKVVEGNLYDRLMGALNPAWLHYVYPDNPDDYSPEDCFFEVCSLVQELGNAIRY